MTIQSALPISKEPGKYARYGTSNVLLRIEGKTRKRSEAEIAMMYYLTRAGDNYTLTEAGQQDLFSLEAVMSLDWQVIEKKDIPGK